MQRRTLKRKIPFPIHLNTSQTALAQQPSLINKREMGKGWGGPGRRGVGGDFTLCPVPYSFSSFSSAGSETRF